MATLGRMVTVQAKIGIPLPKVKTMLDTARSEIWLAHRPKRGGYRSKKPKESGKTAEQNAR